MYVQESELFKELEGDMISQVSQIMIEESHEAGTVLFTGSDPAENLYILMDGRVRLLIGDEAHIDYIVRNPGEAFGWSALVDRATYTATAECAEPTTVIRIEKEKLDKILEKNPKSAMLFFKRLAAAVGSRLVHMYDAFLNYQKAESTLSYGSGQVAAGAED